jgi:hypothetical protein
MLPARAQRVSNVLRGRDDLAASLTCCFLPVNVNVNVPVPDGP